MWPMWPFSNIQTQVHVLWSYSEVEEKTRHALVEGTHDINDLVKDKVLSPSSLHECPGKHAIIHANDPVLQSPLSQVPGIKCFGTYDERTSNNS
jgi:hypothetical protein